MKMFNATVFGAITLFAITASGCAADIDEEESGESTQAHNKGKYVDVDPYLKDCYGKIAKTKSGKKLIERAKERKLRAIEVAAKKKNCGDYSADGVITIEKGNDDDMFEKLADELAHAGGYSPHGGDKDVVREVCSEANARCRY